MVVIGQDPYPNKISRATGLAFEQGDLANWVNRRPTTSLRRIVQLIAHARTDKAAYQRVDGWRHVAQDVRSGDFALRGPRQLFDFWQQQGVLWLNTALTITRFRDPHQTRGHIPLWRPVIRAIVTRLAERPGKPLVILAWGRKACDFLVGCEILRRAGNRFESTQNFERVRTVIRPHPQVMGFLTESNTFKAANRQIEDLGGDPIDW